MRKGIFSLFLTCAVTACGSGEEFKAFQASQHEKADQQKVCDGFLPENDMNIPEGVPHPLAGGITRAQFDDILNRIQAQYQKEVAQYGATLKIERKWSDGTVNAYAYRNGRQWIIAMFGGFARHRSITYDGFASVACHEMGHHLGGAPLVRRDPWASNEGQADYYATVKCLKRFFEKDDNEKILAGRKLDPIAVKTCESEHRGRQDQLLCIRATMAGVSLAGVLKDLEGGRLPALATPDKTKVSKTNDQHPHGQCRLDTYFQGSLCSQSPYSAVSSRDPATGYCYDPNTYTRGLRPRCWYKP